MEIVVNIENRIENKIKRGKSMFQILQAGGTIPHLHCKKENLGYKPKNVEDFKLHLIENSGNFSQDKNILMLHFGIKL